MKVLESKKNQFKELFLKYLSINNIIQRNTLALESAFEIKLTKAPNTFMESYIHEDEAEQQTVSFDRKAEFLLKNENSPSDENTEKKEVIRSYYQNKFIKFPFIIVEITDSAVFLIPIEFLLKTFKFDQVAINMNHQKSKLTINSKNPLKLHGDVDILMELKMYMKFQKSQPLFKLIPRDVHQYLPLEVVEQVR